MHSINGSEGTDRHAWNFISMIAVLTSDVKRCFWCD